MVSVREMVLDLLFPPKCPFCGTLLEKEQLLCPNCQRELPWLSGQAGETRVELTEGCVSALRYEGLVRSAIHDYKFHNRSARSVPFGLLVSQAVQDAEIKADMVSWASLSKKRLRKRGYDQGELLAKEVGKRLNLPVLRTLNKEERPAQSGIEGEAARRANLLGAYTAVEPEKFCGKRILLVDDVVTSGATLSECAKTLLLAGAKEISCATLAKAGK